MNNKYTYEIYNKYGLKPAVYKFLKAINLNAGYSNEKLAQELSVSAVHVGKITEILNNMKIIKDVSLHSARRAWVIENNEVLRLITLAEKENS